MATLLEVSSFTGNFQHVKEVDESVKECVRCHRFMLDLENAGSVCPRCKHSDIHQGQRSLGDGAWKSDRVIPME